MVFKKNPLVCLWDRVNVRIDWEGTEGILGDRGNVV